MQPERRVSDGPVTTFRRGVYRTRENGSGLSAKTVWMALSLTIYLSPVYICRMSRRKDAN
jgi:hypothetical protein